MDFGDIPAAVWSTATAAGMFTGLFWMLATGRLYTGASHREIVADKDRQITVKDTTIESLTTSVRMYAVSAETSAHALHEVEKRAAKAGGDA